MAHSSFLCVKHEEKGRTALSLLKFLRHASPGIAMVTTQSLLQDLFSTSSPSWSMETTTQASWIEPSNDGSFLARSMPEWFSAFLEFQPSTRQKQFDPVVARTREDQNFTRINYGRTDRQSSLYPMVSRVVAAFLPIVEEHRDFFPLVPHSKSASQAPVYEGNGFSSIGFDAECRLCNAGSI